MEICKSTYSNGLHCVTKLLLYLNSLSVLLKTSMGLSKFLYWELCIDLTKPEVLVNSSVFGWQSKDF